MITGFLYYLEHERGNAPATRNQRLTAIRAVMAHALPDYPEHADHIRQILAIPQAKTPKQRLHHLTEPETKALLEAPNTPFIDRLMESSGILLIVLEWKTIFINQLILHIFSGIRR